MNKDKSRHPNEQLLKSTDLNLPSLPSKLEVALSTGSTLPVDGTNVLRVPFGIRQPRKQRPERPERWATLVLPFQSRDNPNPPPQAA